MAKTRTNQPVVELTEDVSKAIDTGELDTKLRIVLEDVTLPAIGGSTSLTQSQLESLDWATLLTANASLEVHFNDDSIVYLDKCVVEESLITFSCSTGEEHFYCVFSTADSGATINAGSITHLQLGGGGTQLYKHYINTSLYIISTKNTTITETEINNAWKDENVLSIKHPTYGSVIYIENTFTHQYTLYFAYGAFQSVIIDTTTINDAITPL